MKSEGRFSEFPPGAVQYNLPVVHEITLILEAAQRGEPKAAERLMETVYGELHALASARMASEYQNVTLQPTALVHEAWLRLGGDQQPAWQNRAHFFAAAAEAMRRILIDRARRQQRVRHGSGQRPVDLDAMPDIAADGGNGDGDARLLAVDEALQRLAAEEPERAQLVKLRYFVGLTIEEAANVLGISESTAKRWWAFARAWLFREIGSE